MKSIEFNDARRAAMARVVLTSNDEEYLLKLERYMKRLSKETANKSQTSYTMEELNTRLEEAEIDIRTGKVMTCEEANAEVRRQLPWLK